MDEVDRLELPTQEMLLQILYIYMDFGESSEG